MSTINTNLDELLKSYKSSLRSDIADQLSVYDEINKKYQLTAGTADRFNNCAKFLAYSIVKNSTRIENYETAFSAKFGRVLKKYYNEHVSDQDLSELCAYIYNYNKEIDNAYKLTDENIQDIKKVKQIYKNIYGFDVENFEILNNSEAQVLFNLLTENETSLSSYDKSYYKLLVLDIIYYAIINKNNISTNNITGNLSSNDNKIVLEEISTSNIPGTNIVLNKYNECLKIYTKDEKELTSIVVSKISDIYIEIPNCTKQIINNIKIYDQNNNEITGIIQTTYTIDNSYNTTKFIYNNIGYIKLPIKEILEKGNITTVVIKNDDTVIDSKVINNLRENKTYSTLYEKYTNYFSNSESVLKEKFNDNNIFITLTNTYNIKINTYKVYYEFNTPTSDFTNLSVEDIRSNEKRNSDSLETYYVLQYSNLNYMLFKDLYINENDTLYTVLKGLFLEKYSESDLQTYGFNVNNKGNQNYCTLSFTILYKELNPEIRSIVYSDVFDYVFGYYLTQQGSSTSLINIDSYKWVNEYTDNYKNSLFLENLITNYDDRMIFFSLKTNSYIVRNSNENDLISYLCGDIIQYGTTSIELDEIDTIKNLYKEVRDYFYAVLLNKAFIVDELYDVYKQLYIKAYTIERFISLKTATIHDINTLNTEDCKNFLISYGLKALYTQIENNTFDVSLTYMQRIIANYNSLMQKKGSREILDEFFTIFNYDTATIEIYKYLLFKDDNKLYFVDIPYNATNVYSNLLKYNQNKIDYNTFITDDPYWSSTELPEDTLKETIISPTNTKYIGVKLKKDIYTSYIKTKYILSLNDYLYDNFLIDTNTKIYDKLIYDSTILNGSNISIIGMYNLCKILFAGYIYLGESGKDHKSSGQKYYGINRTNYIGNTNTSFNFCESTYLTKDLLTKLFDCPYISKNSTTKEYNISSSNTIEFYDVSTKFKPYSYIGVNGKTDAQKILFNNTSIKDISLDYIIPTNVLNNTCVSFDNYSKLEYNTKDIKNTNSTTSITSLDSINEALSSIALINFINGFTDKTTTEYINKLKSIYYYYKLTDNDSTYISEPVSSFTNYNNEFELTNTNFYTHIYNKMLIFPLHYLNGHYFNNDKINYTHDAKIILDEIFEKYYLTNDSDAIGYFTDDASQQTALLNKYASTFVNSKTLSSINTLLEGICAFTIDDSNNITVNVAFDSNKIDSIQEALTNSLSELNSVILLYENLKLDIQFSENTNNLFDFIKTAISFFISYTSSLYNSKLSYSINTKYETIPISYNITDMIINQVFDYLYHDEEIHIDVIDTSTEVTGNE